MSEAAPPAASRPESSSARSTPAPPERSAGLGSVLLAVAYLGFWQIAPRLRTDSLPAILLSTVVSLALILWFTAEFARAIRAPRQLAWNALLAAAVIIPLRLLLLARHPSALWLHAHLPGLLDLLLVWLAASLGALLSFVLRAANMIPPIAVVLALVDIWTVLLGGPVQQMMQSGHPTAKAVVQGMTVQLPTPTVGAAPIPPPAVVGFADFLFIAFFVAAICRFVSAPRIYVRMLVTVIVVLCAYMLIVLLNPYDWALPALLPLALVMIALHWRHFHYSRSETFALLYAALFLAAIAAGFWFFGRQKEPPEGPPRAALPSRHLPDGWLSLSSDLLLPPSLRPSPASS